MLTIFLQARKKKFIKKTLTELIDDQGIHISEQSKILLEQQNFYKSLYSSIHSGCGNDLFFKHGV